MAWKKLGRIYDPEKWVNVAKGGYGANPIATKLDDSDGVRIFFNIRDERNNSHVTWLDYDIEKNEIKSFSGERLISPGDRGTFDDCGCSLGSIVNLGKQLYIYYLGWNLPKNVPFLNRIGMAIYDVKSGRCEKVSPAPILGQCKADPYSISYPFVLKEGDKYRMWYGSNISWGNTTFDHYDFNYVIKYAEGKDGIYFKRENIISIEGDGIVDYAFARPSLVYEDGIYKMWYTYRGEKYRIGYAESEDGITFIRKDELIDIEPSGEGWDSEEVAYPYVFSHNGKHYMLYCGNAYGKTGFGIAVEQ